MADDTRVIICRASRPDDTAVALKGDPVPTPWEPELRKTMHATGRAVYEETVADQLLADLSDASG